MTQIIHLLAQRIAAQLTTGMITAVPSSDPSRATMIQAYRITPEPLSSNIYLYVTSGDPSNTNHHDGRIGARDMEALGLNIPVGEIGGGHYWWRRGRVVVGAYFLTQKFTQLVAANHALTVLGRAIYQTERTSVADLVDDFGERAYQIMVYASNYTEGGGPPDQYLWRGEIYWQALTHRPM